MNNTSLYLSNATLTPSSYYRLTQYFVQTGATIHSTLPNNIYIWWHSKGKYGPKIFKLYLYLVYAFRTLWFLIQDLHEVRNGTIIISRVIVPHHMPCIHRFLITRLARSNRIIWDFDDNILDIRSISKTDFRFFSKISYKIVVTNDYLLSLIDKEFTDKVHILPTTDGDMIGYDISTITTQRQLLYNTEIRLVWVATASGLEYLSPIIPILDEAARLLKERNNKSLSLHIVCNKPLKTITSHLNIVNVLWEREKAKQEIIAAHIGLMPLPDTSFTRGKGGFKLIQYMSASMPVIASNVGFNKQVVTHDVGFLVDDEGTGTTWGEAILDMSCDWDHYLKLSQNARSHYDKHFSYNNNKDFWIKETSRNEAL